MVTGAGCELGGLARLASDPGAGRPRRRDCRPGPGLGVRRLGPPVRARRRPVQLRLWPLGRAGRTVRPESFQVLIDYYDAVAARTRDLMHELTPKDLDQIVDLRWDPPVTLGVRLVSV